MSDNNICFIDAIYKYFGIYKLFLQINDTNSSPEINFYWGVRSAYHDEIMFGQENDRADARLNLIKNIKDRAKNYYGKSNEFLSLGERVLTLLINDIENKDLQVFDDLEEWPDTLKKSDLSAWRNNIKKRIKKSGGELEVGDYYLSHSDWKRYKLLFNDNYHVEFLSFYTSHVGNLLKQKLIKAQAIKRKLEKKSSTLKIDSIENHVNELRLKKFEQMINDLSDHYYIEVYSKRAVKWNQIETKPEELTNVSISTQEGDKQQAESQQQTMQKKKVRVRKVFSDEQVDDIESLLSDCKENDPEFDPMSLPCIIKNVGQAIIDRSEEYPSFEGVTLSSFQDMWGRTKTTHICNFASNKKNKPLYFQKLLPP